MFDFSFYELIVFGIIALIVLGPEKLPHAVRKAGTYYAKFSRTINTLKTEMEAELDLAETRQKMQEELTKIRQAEADMQKEMAQLRGNMQALKRESATAANLQTQPATQDTLPVFETSSSLTTANSTAPASSQLAATHQPDESLHTLDKEVSFDKETSPDEQNTFDKESSFDKQNTFDKKTSEIEPPTHPWQHMWFLLGDYDRAKRLPPAPFLPDYEVQPLLNDAALLNGNTTVNSLAKANNAISQLPSLALGEKVL